MSSCRFNDEIDFLKSNLYDDIDRNKIFENSAKIRIENVLKIQADYFDEELNNLSNSINWDLSDINNIKSINKILNKVYRVISYDRLQLIDQLISLNFKK